MLSSKRKSLAIMSIQSSTTTPGGAAFMSKNSNGIVNQRGFRYADNTHEKIQKTVRENSVYLMDPLPK